MPEWRDSGLVLKDIETQLDIYSLSNLPVLYKITFMLYAFNYIVASVFVLVSMFYSTKFIFLSDLNFYISNINCDPCANKLLILACNGQQCPSIT